MPSNVRHRVFKFQYANVQKLTVHRSEYFHEWEWRCFVIFFFCLFFTNKEQYAIPTVQADHFVRVVESVSGHEAQIPRRSISNLDNYPRTMYPSTGIRPKPRLPGYYFDLSACRGDWAPPLSCRDIVFLLRSCDSTMKLAVPREISLEGWSRVDSNEIEDKTRKIHMYISGRVFLDWHDTLDGK